jgi:hypothetical protein
MPLITTLANASARGYGGLLAAGTAGGAASYESIATVTVGGGGASNVYFGSIPSTFEHLQIRYTGLSASIGSLFMRINNDTNVANYVTHYLAGDGSSVTTGHIPSSSGRSGIIIQAGVSQFNTTYPLIGVIDLLDYANTNKYHVARSLCGIDTNNTGTYKGAVGLISGLHLSTTAINSLEFFLDGPVNFTQYTQFALYGIKGV